MIMQAPRRAVFLHHQTTQRYRGREIEKRKAATHNIDLRFFSYGKQSLEVSCFYSGPFFFYTLNAERPTFNA
jgi:hypothetical protein